MKIKSMEEKNNQKKKKITIAGLALMVAKGFDKMDEKVDRGFKGVNERFTGVEERLGAIETDVAVLKIDVGVLKTDVKEIKANLNKKVDKIEYNTIEYRVEKLEKKPV